MGWGLPQIVCIILSTEQKMFSLLLVSSPSNPHLFCHYEVQEGMG